MQRRILTIIISSLVFTATYHSAFAKGGTSSGRSSNGKSSSGAKTVHVNGYFRKDGSYVAPYDRAAPGSGGGGSSTPRTTARIMATLEPRVTARGQSDDGTGARIDAKSDPRRTARGLPAEGDDPAAGSDDELSLERARRMKAEDDVAQLKKELDARRAAESAQAELEKQERTAMAMLVAAKGLLKEGKRDQAVKMLKSLTERYPNSKFAAEARTMPGVR
jgi:hypothetical protein